MMSTGGVKGSSLGRGWGVVLSIEEKRKYLYF